jgi:(1->4)-alpha-D-glucan 1-alpha-D-glucosylmutase
MAKAIREAKVHTSWVNPNDAYDRALKDFIEGIFQRKGRGSFLASFDAFASRVAEHGIWNSLSQLILKIVSPGVADLYQGTEFWTMTLVDPDNRQPVDFSSRQSCLTALISDWRNATNCDADADPIEQWLDQIDYGTVTPGRVTDFLKGLIESRHDGRIKMFCTMMGLRARRRNPELFADGDYRPLSATGRLHEHVIGLCRSTPTRRLISVVPRWTVGVSGFGGPAPLGDRWEDTVLSVPDETATGYWTNVFTGRKYLTQNGAFPIRELLADWPVALLIGSHQTNGHEVTQGIGKIEEYIGRNGTDIDTSM